MWLGRRYTVDVYQHGIVGSSLSNDAPTPGTCGYTPNSVVPTSSPGDGVVFFCVESWRNVDNVVD